jgi:hypothetical protein
MLRTHSRHPDCVRIWKWLYKRRDEPFTFVHDPAVPADNNGTERDIRSSAAVRSDGGIHRTDWSAVAFARLKSVIVTGMKNQVRFIRYGIEVVRAVLRGCAASVSTALDGRPGKDKLSRPRLGHSLRPPDPLAHPCTANPTRLR